MCTCAGARGWNRRHSKVSKGVKKKVVLLTYSSACTTLGLPMDIFDFDISPTGPAKKLDMGSCAFETGIKEGKITKGGANSEISWGGGLTFKEKN